MLKEIVYWTYRFFYKLRRAQKRKDNNGINGKMDSVMVAFVYKRYFAKEKFSNMIQEYAAKSKRRRSWGSLWAFCYFILTWATFLKSVSLVN